MSFNASEAVDVVSDFDKAIVGAIFISVCALVGVGIGLGLAKAFPGDVERDAYSLINRKK